MKKKYPVGKGKTKITVTVDEDINEELNKYIEENDIYNKSELIQKLIEKQIKKDMEIK